MKVTVCFGPVRVLVPCGAGDLLVRDLVREATLRFNKATGQGPDTWVGVRALRASSGGILDPDDRVCDVADDRETLTAECSSSQTPQPRAAQADGASGSSAGTASPDMFRGGGGVGGSMRVAGPTESCVEVGARDEGAPGLQVRRGSEPTLLQDNLPTTLQSCGSTKRWSAAVVCREEPLKAPEPPPSGPASLQAPHTHTHFQRHSNRLSMQFSGPGSGVWLDAAEKVQNYGSKSLPRDARREPLGQDTPIIQHNHRVEDMLKWVSGVNNVHSVPPVQERPLDLLPELGSMGSVGGLSGPEPPQRVCVTLVKGERGLGFTITTRDNPTQGHPPIYIKNILPKGAAVVDGRLRAGDRLVSVNGRDVSGLSQQHVVSVLRNTPNDHKVTLVVQRPATRTPHRVEPQQSPTKYVEKAIGSPNSLAVANATENSTAPSENGRVSTIVNAFNQNRVSNGSVRGRINKSSSKDNLVNKEQSTEKALQDALNTSSNSVLSLKNRLILRLDVPVHDSEKAGLGISVKGKVTVGSDPQDLGIFIKSVLHGGAASRDGRLHTNDQLLSVNNVSLVGQSNAEAMETLRRALLHARPSVRGSISLTIARRTESMDSLARWKDDTPPSNDTVSSTDNSNSQNLTNTVIYNTNRSTERSVDSNTGGSTDKSDKTEEPTYDTHDGRKRHATIVNINNNSWVSNQSDDSKGYLERDKDASQESKRDSFEWSRLDGWNPVIDRLTGLRNESYYMATQDMTNGRDYRALGHVHMTRSPPAHHNVIIEEEYGTTKGGSNGVCSSESECGDGQFSRDAVGRRSMSEKRHAALDANTNPTYRRIKELKAINAMQVGPSLGMRKSSSLESLQTAIQENQRNPRNEPIYARAHPPLKHWLTDDDRGPDNMIRGSPQQSSLSHKKPSIFKSLSTMFTRKNSKPSKKGESEVIYGRSTPGRSSEKSLSRDALDRHTRLSERSDTHKHRSGQHSRQASTDRSEKEDRRTTPSRTAPAQQLPQAMDSAWGPAGHYANNEELQHDLYVRREKLSEVQIGQMRRQVNAQRAKAEEETRRVGGYAPQRPYNLVPRPHSTYYEYETAAAPPRRPGKLSHYH